ncbi:MAG: hypothetical protein IH911_04610, partial [Proteobacteria bacterium]|nr:hypothetical protein [Pseudomonadota bacterium]
MKRRIISIWFAIFTLFGCGQSDQPTESATPQIDDFDYFAANRTVIRNGVQAILMCNGLFTSGRTLEQVFTQELAYLPDPVGTVNGGEYLINRELKAVAIGGVESGLVIRAAFREGIGCVVMAPNQGFDDIDSLPILKLPYPAGDPASMPWPGGDV